MLLASTATLGRVFNGTPLTPIPGVAVNVAVAVVVAMVVYSGGGRGGGGGCCNLQ